MSEIIKEAFENLDPKSEGRIKGITDEVERESLRLHNVSDSQITFGEAPRDIKITKEVDIIVVEFNKIGFAISPKQSDYLAKWLLSNSKQSTGIDGLKVGDKVKRSTVQIPENYAAWIHLSINTEYTIEYILPNGMIVLDGFLVLVNEIEIEKVLL